MTGSNRRPPACKAGALPAELIPPLSTTQASTCVLAWRRPDRPHERARTSRTSPCVCLLVSTTETSAGAPSDAAPHTRSRRFASSPVSSAPSGHVSRKEVIQPHLPIRLPCYDFTPVMKPTVVSAPLAVRLPTSGRFHSHGVTGGVYKTRERIHRDMLIHDY